MIEDYTDDRPFPSCLVFGRTGVGRPIHVVCAYSQEDDMAVIIKQPTSQIRIGGLAIEGEFVTTQL